MLLDRLHPASSDQGNGERNGEVRWYGEEPDRAADTAPLW